MNYKEKMNYKEIKPKKITEPRNDIPTYYEMSEWLSKGLGEILDKSSNTIMHAMDYPLQMQDEPITEGNLERFKIRLMGTYEWADISLTYMYLDTKVSRWSFLKGVSYLDAFYKVVLKPGLLGPNLKYENHTVASMLSLCKPNPEANWFLNETILWEDVTDVDIIKVTETLDNLGAAKE